MWHIQNGRCILFPPIKLTVILGIFMESRFAVLANQEPESVFLAEGSEVTVFNKTIM